MTSWKVCTSYTCTLQNLRTIGLRNAKQPIKVHKQINQKLWKKEDKTLRGLWYTYHEHCWVGNLTYIHTCVKPHKSQKEKKGPQVLEILKTTHKELFHAQTSLDEISQVSCKYILGLEYSYLLDWMWHMLIKQLVIVGRNLLTFGRATDRPTDTFCSLQKLFKLLSKDGQQQTWDFCCRQKIFLVL